MPKINIDDETTPGWRGEVSWRAARTDLDILGHVQVATVNRDSPFEFPEKTVTDAEGHTHWTAAEPFDGWHVTLDPAGIDRMIDALRQAKREAYGEE